MVTLEKNGKVQRILRLTSGVMNVDEIMYIEAKKGRMIFYLYPDIKIYELGFLDTMEMILLEYQFIRCHRLYLLNPEYIISKTKRKVQMKNNDVIPIARKLTYSFDKKIRKYILYKNNT